MQSQMAEKAVLSTVLWGEVSGHAWSRVIGDSGGVDERAWCKALGRVGVCCEADYGVVVVVG